MSDDGIQSIPTIMHMNCKRHSSGGGGDRTLVIYYHTDIRLSLILSVYYRFTKCYAGRLYSDYLYLSDIGKTIGSFNFPSRDPSIRTQYLVLKLLFFVDATYSLDSFVDPSAFVICKLSIEGVTKESSKFLYLIIVNNSVIGTL